MRHPLSLPLLAVAGLPLLAGCGGEAPRPPAVAARPATAGRLVVELRASQFSPATLDGRVGEEITFVNRDGIAHTATATAGARFDSGAMTEGARFSFTPRAAGVISVVCVLHPGMTGSIAVS